MYYCNILLEYFLLHCNRPICILFLICVFPSTSLHICLQICTYACSVYTFLYRIPFRAVSSDFRRMIKLTVCSLRFSMTLLFNSLLVQINVCMIWRREEGCVLMAVGWPFYLRFWFPAVSNFTCTDGEIKLIGGTAAYEGTIQVCMNNRFGTICDEKFNSVAAGVVCNSLGYPRQGKCMRCLQAPVSPRGVRRVSLRRELYEGFIVPLS